ncbi:U3 small nucleolar RNA-associated protein [Thozetella sp. PMI_491]|nr:U3 small nucleolar RNA-associated protein [Thozetella sp. PMI_491]
MSATRDEELSEESFSGFDDEDDVADVEAKESTKVSMLEKDSDEESLENFVLGNRASFWEQLRDDLGDASALVPAGDPGAKGHGDSIGQEDIDDSQLFFIDTGGSGAKPVVPTSKAAEEIPLGDAPAWEDSDDERLSVSLVSATRHRKLRIAEGEDLVNGTEYARRLRQQFLRLYPLPEWAKQAGERDQKRWRRSSASSRTSIDSLEPSEDSDDEGSDSALPLERFLRDANSFNGNDARKRRKLRPETIEIQRSRDIPDKHKDAVSSLSFHPQQPILLSASTAAIVYLHHIAPDAYPTPHPMLTSVQVKSTPIRRAEFLHPGGDEVVFAGRRKYFHTWNLASGHVKKITKVQGHQKEHKTMERFRLSPCGRYMGLVATDQKGGGNINIFNAKTLQWAAQARIESRGGLADFAWWSNGDGMTILGKDGSVAEWSMAKGRTLGTWRDSGNIGGTVVAVGGHNGPHTLGHDRWVAVGSTSGILNIYDRSVLVSKSSAQGLDGAEIVALPEPTKTLETLVTAITATTFSPDGQILAFASKHKKDALRLVHLPTCTIYRNWPTSQTPVGRVTAVTFSAGSDTMAVGNDSGKIRLWEIRG